MEEIRQQIIDLQTRVEEKEHDLMVIQQELNLMKARLEDAISQKHVQSLKEEQETRLKAKAKEEAEQARKELTESLLTLAPVFSETPYFLNEEFSLIDCCLAPLLWRLPAMGIELTGRGAKEVTSYMELLFERESFQASLSDIEREMRP